MALLTAAQVRARQPQRVSSDAAYSDELLEGLVAEFTELATLYRGVAYEEKTTTQVFGNDRHGNSLFLGWPLVSSIDEVTIDGQEWSGSYTLDGAAGLVYGLPTSGVLAVTYTHGHSTAPPTLLRACALWVALEAVASMKATVDNAYSVVAADGSIERRSTADWIAGRPTGWQPVDAALNQLPDYRVPGIG